MYVDRYSRTVGLVYIADGTNVNLHLVAALDEAGFFYLYLLTLK